MSFRVIASAAASSRSKAGLVAGVSAALGEERAHLLFEETDAVTGELE